MVGSSCQGAGELLPAGARCQLGGVSERVCTNSHTHTHTRKWAGTCRRRLTQVIEVRPEMTCWSHLQSQPSQCRRDGASPANLHGPPRSLCMCFWAASECRKWTVAWPVQCAHKEQLQLNQQRT
jgi:hypothetical protein